ncbi:MAG: GtrA family protein [Verrucomicrobiaceae bacterium]|nr:GtrA family protein [Verrucomicrobiaceae bacterium]
MTLVQKLLAKDTHPFIQFIKYGICGVSALVTHVILFRLLISQFWPHLMDPAMDAWDKAVASLFPTFLVFLVTNALVYFLNTRWVFTSGRHSPVKEFFLFTLVNTPGAFAGALGQAALIRYLNWDIMTAMVGFVVPNALINFICRKFFIFKH